MNRGEPSCLRDGFSWDGWKFVEGPNLLEGRSR